jgi:hypothetical protein
MMRLWQFFMGTIFGLLVIPAHAIPVKWTIHDAAFDNGETLSGSFVFDADTVTYSDIQITASWLTTESYTTITNTYYYGLGVGTWDPDTDEDNSNCQPECYDLYLGFYPPPYLTNDGGTVGFGSAGTWYSGYDSEWDEIAYHEAVSGYVTSSAVPVPAAVWLFGSALAGLGWLRRKQTV